MNKYIYPQNRERRLEDIKDANRCIRDPGLSLRRTNKYDFVYWKPHCIICCFPGNKKVHRVKADWILNTPGSHYSPVMMCQDCLCFMRQKFSPWDEMFYKLTQERNKSIDGVSYVDIKE